MSTVVSACTEEVTAQDIALIERVLAEIDRKNSYSEILVLWKFAFGLFKKFDLHFTCLKDRSRLETAHKEVLRAMISVSELVINSNCLSEEELAGFQTSTEANKSALRFLQRKYKQWYVPLDEGVRLRVDSVLGGI